MFWNSKVQIHFVWGMSTTVAITRFTQAVCRIIASFYFVTASMPIRWNELYDCCLVIFAVFDDCWRTASKTTPAKLASVSQRLWVKLRTEKKNDQSGQTKHSKRVSDRSKTITLFSSNSGRLYGLYSHSASSSCAGPPCWMARGAFTFNGKWENTVSVG